MPLFRHHALLLVQEELVEGPLVGPAFRVRPSDGDGLSDKDQHWVAVFDLLVARLASDGPFSVVPG
jgi:hypothetical protein